MVAFPELLPDNPLELTKKVPLTCCESPDLLIDTDVEKPGLVSLRCKSCGIGASVKETNPGSMRDGNFLKNRKRIRRAMGDTLTRLITKFNLKVITGLDEE